MRTFDFVVLLFLLFLLFTGVAFFLLNLDIEKSQGVYIENQLSEPVYSSGLQFYSNMRFPDKEISYEVESACNMQKRREVNEAFALLAEKTILDFHLLESGAQIQILCSEAVPEEDLTEEGESYFVAGEGGPTAALNLSNGYYLILSGKASFFRTEKCNETKLALHEILHVLGFDHNENPKSIMYPITNCDQVLDDYIVEELNRVYSVPSLPDLVIEKVSVNKTLYVASFFIIVSNSGFVSVQNSRLDVFSEGSKVTGYDLGPIKPGTKKTLEVQNAKLPRKARSLLFVVSSDKKDELSLGNNKAEVFLVGSNL